MKNLPRLFVNIVVALLLFGIDSFGVQIRRKAMSFEPQFEAPLQNLTVVEGREASFTCIVSHLGGYRVAWIKADSKAILAIHNRVITHSKRMRVVHSDHNTWTLHIKNVQQNDSGQYMCQINTDPMKMQVGVLEVVVPPDINLDDTSGDIMVTEGSTARLVCRARGVPPPTITWKREDRQPIVLRSQGQPKKEVNTWDGAELTLEKISRGEMGAYFCIASNGHPPSVSKRIVVNVHFHPIVHVPNQLLGAPQDTNISLECMVEASPKSINYWTQVFKNQSTMIVENPKYKTEENATNAYSVTLKLTIFNLESKDFGEYACTAKNSIGEVEGTIKVYEIMPATPKTTLPPIMQVNRVIIPDGKEDFADYPYLDYDYPPDEKDRHSYRNAGHTGKKAGHHIPTSVTSTTSPQILRPHHSFPAPFPPSAGESGSGAGSPFAGVVVVPLASLLVSWVLLSFVRSWFAWR